MKGVKCLGLLIFFITCLLSSSLSLDVKALKHDYESVPLMIPYVPQRFITNSNNRTEIDWNYNYTNLSFSQDHDFLIPDGHFELYWSGDGYYSDLENLAFKDRQNPLIMNNMGYLDGLCRNSQNSFSSVIDGFTFSTSSTDPDYHYGGIYSANRYYDNKLNFFAVTQQDLCYRKQAFGTSPQPSFTTDGMSEINKLAYLSNLDPYWYAYDGFYIHSSFVSDSGVHYNHSFSFSDIFNQNISKFSKMVIPLYDYSDYWFTPSNFYSGRQVEWRGAFKFDESFSINNDLPANSSFQVVVQYGLGRHVQGKQYIPCTFNTVTVPDIEYEQLEYTCSGTLSQDSAWVLPYLELNTPDSYYFETTGKWYFANQLLITDNDESRGQSFGALDRGFGNAESDYENENNADWFQSLINMFNFGLINPFAPIFELFNDQSTCVQIPTLAGMLHSEETQVCPWFSSQVRSITTPVLGISSMMLLFGFVVRWLGSSSGNLFEDSASESIKTPMSSGTWGRGKK